MTTEDADRPGSSRWSSSRLGRLSSLDSLLANRTPEPGERSGAGELDDAPERPDGTTTPLAPSADDDPGLGRLRQIDVDEIRPNEFQPRRRFEESALASLTDSVRELGVLQPILVRPIQGDGGQDSGYELIAGERRWRAARRAGLEKIPAVVRELTDVRSLEEAIVENLHRSDLNAMEEAAAYQQLVDEFSFSQGEVAHRVGKSRSAVANTLRLLQLPGSVQRLVVEGTLTPGHARAVLAVASHQQRAFAERILAEGLSVRQAEEVAAAGSNVRSTDSDGEDRVEGDGSGRSTQRSGSASDLSAGALEVQSRLEALLQTRVGVTETAQGGRIQIDFADTEDLVRIFGLLGSRPPGDV